MASEKLAGFEYAVLSRISDIGFLWEKTCKETSLILAAAVMTGCNGELEGVSATAAEEVGVPDKQKPRLDTDGHARKLRTTGKLETRGHPVAPETRRSRPLFSHRGAQNLQARGVAPDAEAFKRPKHTIAKRWCKSETPLVTFSSSSCGDRSCDRTCAYGSSLP